MKPRKRKSYPMLLDDVVPRSGLAWALGAGVLASVALFGWYGAAHAVTTRQFLIDSAAVFSDGKLVGAAVLSSGAVVASAGVERVELANVGVARSLLVLPDGSAIVGTGNQGKLFKVVGNSASPWVDSGELLVTALASDAAGTVYAGTLPHGKIFAIDKQGKSRLFAQPAGAEHIWALVHDPRRKRLFAATGPEGKIFAIETSGEKRSVELYFETQTRHVMALALDPNGVLYAGTSDDALLLRIDAAKRGEVVYDFEGNELTAIALRDGRLAVAANNFPKQGGEKKKDAPKDEEQPSGDKGDAAKEAAKPGTGDLWVVEPNGEARKLFGSSDDGHLTAVQWAGDDAIYAATGKAGHVYRVKADGTYALWLDVDERQVLGMDLAGAHPMFTTADAGAVYRVLPGPASEALWTSKVLDAQFPSRFGQLNWRGRGKLAFQTRSGNTEKPGIGWGEWSSALAEPGPIRSPAARFLQIRARLQPRDESELYAVQAYYLPANQSATSKEISVKPAPARSGEDGASSLYKLEWKTDNPDGDRLRYRLYYRSEARPSWRPIVREGEVLTRPQYDWNTDGVPDGYYRLRVDASDELDNPASATRVQQSESEPFLIDNHPPHVYDLRFANGKLTGIARDSQGPISRLEYTENGQDWQPLRPRDDLLDTREEPFELNRPDLAKGSHLIAVRARDARNNVATAELWISGR
jgi:outer membrane protein assembly factor BamB